MYQRNAIISGYIDSYCLVCQCLLETVKETISHVASEKHAANLSSHPYLEKYKNNCIRKVKAGYFCECCSVVMTTAARVNLHISENQHILNKGTSLLKQTGSGLTAFNNVLIKNNAWNTFSDDTCALCDVEFDDASVHASERSHLLKLVQSKVLFGEDHSLYRKIDKNDFQCLTCNTVHPLTNLEEHLSNDIHNHRYAASQLEKIQHDKENAAQIDKYEKDKITLLHEVIEKKSINKPELVLTELIATKAVGKIESGNREVDTKMTANIASVEKVIKETEENIPKTSTNQTEKLIAETQTTQKAETPKMCVKSELSTGNDTMTQYALDNNLAYSQFNSVAFCKTCSKKCPSTMQNMMEHVAGREHSYKTEKAKVPADIKKKMHKLEKKRLDRFNTDVHSFPLAEDNDVVINDAYCLTEMSMHTIIKMGSMYSCVCCDHGMGDDEEDVIEHCGTAKHERNMCNAEVILNLGNEYVRELRPDLFHCGFCNANVTNWPAMESHLKTGEHKSNAAARESRLHAHLQAIHADERQWQELAQEALLEMFFHMRM